MVGYRYCGCWIGLYLSVLIHGCFPPSPTNKESAIPCLKTTLYRTFSAFITLWNLMEKNEGPKPNHPNSGILPLLNTRNPAISPRRRRMLRSRSRTVSLGNGSLILVSSRTCTNKIHPHPSIKVLRSFFKSDRSPRSPVPPFPIAGSHSPPRHKDGRCKGGIGGWRRREAPERHGGGADRAQRRLRRQRGARIRDRRRERP